jgi:hypothetical protein
MKSKLTVLTAVAQEGPATKTRWVAWRWVGWGSKTLPKKTLPPEGRANFDGLQAFLWCVHIVSAEARLSRFAYLARKAKPARPRLSLAKPGRRVACRDRREARPDRQRAARTP